MGDMKLFFEMGGRAVELGKQVLKEYGGEMSTTTYQYLDMGLLFTALHLATVGRDQGLPELIKSKLELLRTEYPSYSPADEVPEG